MVFGQGINKRAVIFIVATALQLAAKAAAPDVVPLTFINGLPFVHVTVGAAPTLLMLDSGGALGISLPEATVAKAGSVTLTDHKTRFSDLSGNVFEVQDLVADHVVVGATRLDQINGRIHTQWGGAPEGPEAELTKARQAGAMGLEAFGNRSLMFDYGQRTLTIFEPGEGPQANDPEWQTLQLDYGKEGPHVTLLVGGKALKFVLDTGAQVNLVNPEALGPAPEAQSCERPTAQDEGCDPRLLPDVRDTGGHPLGAMKAERVKLNGAPFDGILGASFFATHRVVFDLIAHRLLIAPLQVNSESRQ